MMSSSLFNLYGLIFLLLLLAAFIKANKSYIKGWFGEFMVNMLTRLQLDKKVYHLIKNVTLPTEDAGTTQIDHIIVSKYGIFVVETKNMKGWIFGSQHGKEWTQTIYKHKTRFQNPLRQNHKHTKTLEEILGLLPDKIFSLIVFTGEATFKTDMPENVTYIGGYIDYIKSKKEPLLGEFEVFEIIKKIENIRYVPNLQTHRKHVDYLRDKHSEPAPSQSKPPKAHPVMPLVNAVLFGFALLILTGITKNYIDGKRNAALQVTTAQQESGITTTENTQDYQIQEQSNQPEDKIYQWEDNKGKTQYTNVGKPKNGKLINDSLKKSQNSLPIEISNGKIYVTVTVGNNGTELKTSLLLDRNCSKTVLPTRVADFVKSENVSVTGFANINGEVYPGETRRISYFNVGNIVETGFFFLATDIPQLGKRGVLGMDFISKHPFQVDEENKCLNWL